LSDLFLTPLVIAHRLPQLWFEALHPNPMVHDESKLAVTEKIEAFSEGLMASQVAVMTAPLGMAVDLMSGRSPFSAAYAAQQKIAKAATRPVEKRLRHNMRRLKRR